MKTLVEHLSQYAAYHRDTRNIISHFVGIPMIVQAIAILLARPTWLVAGLELNATWLMCLLLSAFYLKLDRPLGALMSVLLILCALVGQHVAAYTTGAWLGFGIGLFVVGWVIQFVGHYFEGRKPAFLDDVSGLIVGPIFVVAEMLFMLGLCQTLKARVEAQAGPQR